MKQESTNTAEPWYAVWGERYRGDQPAFYRREDLPWTRVLEENWEVIRDELLHLLEARPDRLRPYSINHSMSFPPKRWKTMGLLFWGYRMSANCAACPQTMRIIGRLPGCTSFSLSILEPGANINPHQGDTDAVIRCHMGLVVPAGLPDLGFQVGSEIRPWEEGKTLPFCDARTHTAWNQTDARRYVVILDIIRPEFAHRKLEICSHVLASAAVQMIYPRFALLERKSGYVKKAIYHLARIGIRGVLTVRNWKRPMNGYTSRVRIGS